MAEEVKISRTLTIKDIGITLDDSDTISTTERPIPRREELKDVVIQEPVVSHTLGFSDLQTEYRNPEKTSGQISNRIQIEKSDYVTLVSSLNEQTKDDFYSVEYTIIDNNQELPILPVNQSQIYYEKLFYNLPTRFSIDENYKILIHEIGDTVSLYKTYNTYDEYNADKNNLNIVLKNKTKNLVISYTPRSGKRLTLKNTIIYLKIIKRLYVSKNPIAINYLILNAHGGNVKWNI